MLVLNDVSFAPVHCATGARGFYGEGYPFHSLWKFFGMNWDHTGLSGKTMTLEPRKGAKYIDKNGKPQLGNMELEDDGVTPKELFPRCITANFLRHGGEVLNAVGLSNFGLEFYLKTGRYQRWSKPFFISISLDATDDAGKESEIFDVCTLIRKYGLYRAPMALQINVGCPNSGHDPRSFLSSLSRVVEIAKTCLTVPVFVNSNALMPTKVLTEVSRTADGLWIGNTIPWRAPETVGKIDWDVYGALSPIRARGVPFDGGLSSHQCLQFTIDTVSQLRDIGVKKPIVAGNGIRTILDVRALKHAGADGVFIGSLGIVRPRRMQQVIDVANVTFST